MNEYNNSQRCACNGKECKDCSACQGGKHCGSLQTQTLIRGLLALFFGLLFVGFAYRIVLRMIFFGAGVSLIYYGFRVLGVTQVTDCIDNVVARVRRAFWS